MTSHTTVTSLEKNMQRNCAKQDTHSKNLKANKAQNECTSSQLFKHKSVSKEPSVNCFVKSKNKGDKSNECYRLQQPYRSFLPLICVQVSLKTEQPVSGLSTESCQVRSTHLGHLRDWSVLVDLLHQEACPLSPLNGDVCQGM